MTMNDPRAVSAMEDLETLAAEFDAAACAPWTEVEPDDYDGWAKRLRRALAALRPPTLDLLRIQALRLLD